MQVAPDENESWPEGRPDSRLTTEQALAEERLAFTDRIIGLEQQVRELQSAPISAPSEAAAIEANYAAMTSTLTWRAGRVVTLPIRVLRYVKRRVLR